MNFNWPMNWPCQADGEMLTWVINIYVDDDYQECRIDKSAKYSLQKGIWKEALEDIWMRTWTQKTPTKAGNWIESQQSLRPERSSHPKIWQNKHHISPLLSQRFTFAEFHSAHARLINLLLHPTASGAENPIAPKFLFPRNVS